MLRAVLILHRYVGVVLGVLMTLWCLSGFVMMYQSYPELSEKERLGALQPLSLAGCCNVPVAGLDDDTEVSDFRIEMLGGKPVLILPPAEDRSRLIDLTTGQPKTVTLIDATATAALFGRSRNIEAPPQYVGEVEIDQWTIQTARRNGPVHHFRFPDGARTEVYVSGQTGEAFQDTTRRERVLSWLGAIPHWLYPTVLRQNGPLWVQVVVWTSTLGVFLTVTGLFVGITRLRKLPDGRWSPFRGWWFWHHMIGLFFGVLTLTWVFSGLLTMNPWGLLEGKSGWVRAEMTGKAPLSEIRRAVANAPHMAGVSTVQITSALLPTATYLLAVDAAGQPTRYDIDAISAPLQESDVRQALATLPTTEFKVLEEEDAYYYAHHSPVRLPVYRAILTDPQKTHVYVDYETGKVLRIVDAAGRQSRWLSTALHDFDFPVLRKRPIWDLVVIPLLLGVTAVCLTGTWLGFQRLGRDAGTVRVLWRRRRRARTTPEGPTPSGSR